MPDEIRAESKGLFVLRTGPQTHRQSPISEGIYDNGENQMAFVLRLHFAVKFVDTQPGGDRLGRGDLVAGRHHHTNARIGQLAQRLERTRFHWIRQALSPLIGGLHDHL